MQSPQQLLYNLYNTVALTEIKGYTMIQFSYMLLRLYNKGTWYRQSRLNTSYVQHFQRRYLHRVIKTNLFFFVRLNERYLRTDIAS